MITDTAAILKEKGINPSVQRISILDYLLTYRTHPTVDDIFHDLSHVIPTLSKTTIYNTLTLFAQSGLIINFQIDDSGMHYDGYPGAHVHFRCNTCGRIYDLPFPAMTKPKAEGFKIEEIKMFYYGTCKDCLNMTNDNNNNKNEEKWI